MLSVLKYPGNVLLHFLVLPQLYCDFFNNACVAGILENHDIRVAAHARYRGSKRTVYSQQVTDRECIVLRWCWI